ncbi:MAG: hypothetical protein J3K34DRAFT_109522 [Monoraphidium minutum]|nr:MAG: hypothetical protein J3K34DRAFT_109522 [Monoraphidium minutum]
MGRTNNRRGGEGGRTLPCKGRQTAPQKDLVLFIRRVLSISGRACMQGAGGVVRGCGAARRGIGAPASGPGVAAGAGLGPQTVALENEKAQRPRKGALKARLLRVSLASVKLRACVSLSCCYVSALLSPCAPAESGAAWGEGAGQLGARPAAGARG